VTWILGRDDWLSRRLVLALGAPGVAARTGQPRLLGDVGVGDLAGASVVVLPSLLTDDWGVAAPEAAARLLARCAERGPAHVIVVSSFAAHEPNHHHPGLVDEGFSPPRARAMRFDNQVTRRWRELEAAARAAFDGRCPLTILRAAATPAPDGRCVLSRLLLAPVAAVLPGYDPQIQLLDAGDLARAVAIALARRPEGVLHVAPAGTIPLRAALRLAGRRRLPIPLFLRRAARWAPWRHRSRDADGRRIAREELDWLRFPATQSDDALRHLGYTPRWTSAQVAVRLRRLDSDGAMDGVMDRAMNRPMDSALDSAPDFDDWGMSPRFVRGAGRTVFRFLRKVWFRAEIEGTAHVPTRGPAVLAGTHRGFVPLDAMLALDALVRERGRWPRFLVHPGLLRWPFIATIITRLGGVVACRENAERLLARGDVVGVFPEGLRGPFRLQREAHRVGRFLSDDFVDWARRHRAPLIPLVTLGAAEAFPILGKIESRWWRRQTEWPFFPLTPTTPFLPIPLPVKWRMRFLEPIEAGAPEETAAPSSPAQRAADRGEVSAALRATLQRELDALVVQRRSVLLG
jgi:1-acyl-sn-glycerol-3-phosphate acyltransferase/nucleoside-diphosphate-sugar epimerase